MAMASKYPDFLDHTYTEISRYTKGSGIYRFMFESNHLIPGVQWISDLSYLPNQAATFYGFNGYESVYNKDWMDDKLLLHLQNKNVLSFSEEPVQI